MCVVKLRIHPHVCSVQAHAGQFDCGDGKINQMALLLFAGQEDAIHALFSTGNNGEFDYGILVLFFVVFLGKLLQEQ